MFSFHFSLYAKWIWNLNSLKCGTQTQLPLWAYVVPKADDNSSSAFIFSISSHSPITLQYNTREGAYIGAPIIFVPASRGASEWIAHLSFFAAVFHERVPQIGMGTILVSREFIYIAACGYFRLWSRAPSFRADHKISSSSFAIKVYTI